ncbi:MAG TPA: hypothetical protein VH309_04620 [Elusimicrobiota bacterium]|nr:hypothetical protein [Elusimicrobiota bacterium]
MKSFLLAVAAAALAACAGPRPAPSYPAHETAVVRTYVHNLGFKGYFASEGTQEISTRGDMRRREDRFEFSGFVMKHLAKARDAAKIWRVDKGLLWEVDLPGKTYTECPLTGCVSSREPAARRPEREPAPEPPPRKPSCRLTIAKNAFRVKATGQTRAINGFDTREYEVVWTVVARDHDKKKDTSSLNIDLWTAPEDDPRIRAVKAVDRRFDSGLHAREPREAGLGRAVPADAMKILELEFMNGFSAGQRASLLNSGRELGKIHGFPISTTLNWYLDGDACSAAPAPEESGAAASPGLDLTHGLGGLLGGAAGMAARKGTQEQAQGAAGKPVFGFVEEVREMKVEQASDGLFVPPPGFKLVSQGR